MPWSEDPNAPQIPPFLYLAEKENFAGLLIGTILYGMLPMHPSICTHSACSPYHLRGHHGSVLQMHLGIA